MLKSFYNKRTLLAFDNFVAKHNPVSTDDSVLQLQVISKVCNSFVIDIFDWLNVYTFDGSITLKKFQFRVTNALLLNAVEISIGIIKLTALPKVKSLTNISGLEFELAGPNGSLRVFYNPDKNFWYSSPDTGFVPVQVNQVTFLQAIMSIA